MKPPGRVLALDLGKKRIGLAISDGLGITAQGLPTLERRNKRTDLAALATLIKNRDVTQVLMGNPLHMSGTAGRQSEWAREFAGAIEKRAAAVDKLSAVILLQSYLDSGQSQAGDRT